MKRYLAIATIGMLMGCSSPQPEEVIEETPMLPAETQPEVEEPEVPAPETFEAVWNPQSSDVDAETRFQGTWVAEVSGAHIRTGGVSFSFGGGKKIKSMDDLVEATMEAIDKDLKERDHCIWLELYPDGTGFWSNCMMNVGEPSATEKIDPFTGDRMPLGIKFDWYGQKDTLKIRFEDRLTVTHYQDTVKQNIKVTYWNLVIEGTTLVDNEPALIIHNEFPEYQYRFPGTDKYMIVAGYLDGQVKEYAKPPL